MTKLHPISKLFNQAVHMAVEARQIRMELTGDVSLTDSVDKVREHLAKTGKLLVWTGGSDNTIFGDRMTNWLFRAWHDAIHLDHNLPFTLEGEAATCEIHKQDVRNLFPQLNTNLLDRLLEIEIIEQAKHYHEFSQFPSNQVEFTLNHLQLKKAA